MSKSLISQVITYSVIVGDSNQTFATLKEAREAVRSLEAAPGTTVQIVKNLSKSEILNTYTAQEKRVMSFVSLEAESDESA